MLRSTHLIVLAGGRGERVAGISRRLYGLAIPKQFCTFGGKLSLLQATVQRFEDLVPSWRTSVVVTGEGERAAEQLRAFDGVRVLDQPMDRGTATGLLLAILEVAGRDPDALCIITPADHAYDNEDLLREALAEASTRLRGPHFADSIVVVGAVPNAPRSDFGWIVPGSEHASTGLQRVAYFEEKPPTVRAKALMELGGVWNTLVMVGSARAFLQLYGKHARDAMNALLPVFWLDDGSRSDLLHSVYPTLALCDISRDLLSCADELVLGPLSAEAGWDDLGDETRLLRWMAHRGGPSLARAKPGAGMNEQHAG